MIPGEVISTGEPINVNAGLLATQISVTNRGQVPVHLTAHFHIFEANPRLEFNRLKAYGMRLDTHAKGSIRFEPGESKTVDIVPIGGRRVIYGFNGAVNGPLDDIDPQVALDGLTARGFLHREEE